MTAAGRTRKPRVSARWAAGLAIAASLTAAFVLTPPLHAATTERVVVDRLTGLALYGVDPVAYFTNRKQTAGSADFEYRFAGAIWRFENAGNRAAFMADPQVYMPRFGGYDPVGVARGVSTAGYPALWTVFENRLYLFYTADARAVFLADPAGVIANAEARWPQVAKTLAE
jgi:hypothetical protein